MFLCVRAVQSVHSMWQRWVFVSGMSRHVSLCCPVAITTAKVLILVAVKRMNEIKMRLIIDRTVLMIRYKSCFIMLFRLTAITQEC